MHRMLHRKLGPGLLAFAALMFAVGAITYTGNSDKPVGLGSDDEPGSDSVALERAPLFTPHVPRAERERDRLVPGRVIVRFHPGVSESQKERVRDEVGVRLVRELPLPGTELVSFARGRSVDGVRRAFEERQETAYSEPDVIYGISNLPVPSDPRYAHLWGLNNTTDTDIDAPEAWSLTTGSPDVTVGVVDTGVAADHPDLATNIWSNPGESGAGRESNGADDDGNGYIDDVHGWDWVGRDNDAADGHGHGTHVAGTVGATGNNGIGVAGVNWSAGIVPLRVLDAGGAGTSSSIAAAFAYAGKMGLDVVNASLGGPSYSQTVVDAIKRSPNTLFVAAAGNDALDNDEVGSYPCNYPVENLLCVAAVTQTDTLASFSNFGSKTVHIGAPGQAILSTLPASSGVEYGSYSGTSMAAPHVAGAAALLGAARPAANMSEVRAAVLSGAVPIAALHARTISGARLNLAGSLSALGVEIPTSVPTSELTPVASASRVPIASPSASTGRVEQAAPVESASPVPAKSSPAPAPAVSPPPPPVAPSPAIASRSVELRLVRHLVAKVVISSLSSVCETGTQVVVTRQGVPVAGGTTNAAGRFEVRLKDRTGRYAVVVPAGDDCARGVARARHRHGVSASQASPNEIDAFVSTCWELLPAERRLRRLHNLARLAEGVGRYRMDGEMSKLARAHSHAMMQRGSIFHRSDLGEDLTGWSFLGENVGLGSSPDSLHDAFMASDAHRTNILGAEFTHVGVGIVDAPDRMWVTVIFKAATRPRPTPQLPMC